MPVSEPIGRGTAQPPRVPFGLVGAAVLFWGWQTGWLAIAVPLALLLEIGRLLRGTRLALPFVLEREGLDRVADLSSLLLIAVGGWLAITLDSPRAARTVIGMAHWLPVTLAPLALAQVYLTRAPLDLSVLFLTLRRRPPTGIGVDFGFLYVIACVLGAAAANVRTEMFYGGVAVFAAWSLWNLRSRRWPRLAPFAMLFIASILGYGGHVMLNELQATLSDWASELADSSEQTNPWRARTDIGHLGKLKLSERILFRARIADGLHTPLLVHRASYNTYGGQAWTARDAEFRSVAGEPQKGWHLAGGPTSDAEDAAAAYAVEVLEYTRTGEAILSLPSGTSLLSGLPPAEVRRNRFDGVGVQTAPGFIRYRASRAADDPLEESPDDGDLAMPARETRAVRDIAAGLGLRGRPPAEALRRIQAFFAENFRYSTWQEAAPDGVRTPIGTFLTRTRAGHCEYFATATALLLRAAGVPARYATGFAVMERAGDDPNEYVVRERHAHSWVRAYMDGQWIDIDTTPPQWIDEEEAEARNASPAWQKALADRWSAVVFAWARLQTSEEEIVPLPVLFALPAVLLLWLLWRIFGTNRRREARVAAAPAAQRLGTDSEFYRIERVLAGQGLPRNPDEPVTAWLERLVRESAGQTLLDPDAVEELRRIAKLHYRLRFDPKPIDRGEREELRERVESWLARRRTVEV